MVHDSAIFTADASVVATATVDTIASSTANAAVSTTTVASTSTTAIAAATSANTTIAVSVSNAGGKARRQKPQQPQKRQVLLFIWMPLIRFPDRSSTSILPYRFAQ